MSVQAIFPSGVADRFKSRAGDSYRPSNSSEGELFECAWCDRCQRDQAFRRDENKLGCPILTYATGFDIGDPEYPKEWVYDVDGQPICTAFTQIVPTEPRGHLTPRCKCTIDMFGGV